MADFLSSVLERPDEDFRLSTAEVHVWIIDNVIASAVCDRLLSPDELSAAKRLTGINQVRFKQRRGVLRSILGRYLAERPNSLELRVATHGKPYVNHGEVQFNLSHSHDVVAIAVAQNNELGIDIEELRPIADSASIADKFFNRTEIVAITRASPSIAHKIFLDIWTRKEAILKAAGVGITDGLNVSVPTQDRLRANEVIIELSKGPCQLYLYDLRLGPRLVGALASHVPVQSILQRTLEDSKGK